MQWALTKSECTRGQVLPAVTTDKSEPDGEGWAVRMALGEGKEYSISPWGSSHLESTGTRGARMIILEEEVQDGGGEEEAPTTEKHHLSQQVLPQNLPSASPPTSCL